MLTDLGKGFILDVLRGPECAFECNSIKSHKTVAVEAILKNGNFRNGKYRRY